MIFVILAFLLFLTLAIILFFDLRYSLFSLLKNVKIKEYPPLNKKVNVAIIIPVKNEKLEILRKRINNIMEIKNIEFEDMNFYFIIVDDTNFKKAVARKILDKLPAKIYYYKNFLVYDFGNFHYLFRLKGIKMKGPAVNDAVLYAKERFNIEYFALYDVEWTITLEYIAKAVRILENRKDLSFIFWNRRTVPWDDFHRILGIYVDHFFETTLYGKTFLDRVSMAHGSCGVFRLKDFLELNGFKPHITEDAELTVRMYLNGKTGLYVRDWIEYGQNLPGNINVSLKTYLRWAFGTIDVVLTYFKEILVSKKMNLMQKLSLIHMFTHFYSFAIAFILILANYVILTFNIISPDYYTLEPFFLYITPIIFVLLILIYIPTYYRIYRKINLVDLVKIVILGWGLSVIHIYALLKRIFIGREEWIVTKKIKEKELIRKEIFSIYLLFLFIILPLFVVYLIYNIFDLKKLIFGGMAYFIWVISLFWIISLQLKHEIKL